MWETIKADSSPNAQAVALPFVVEIRVCICKDRALGVRSGLWPLRGGGDGEGARWEVDGWRRDEGEGGKRVQQTRGSMETDVRG